MLSSKITLKRVRILWCSAFAVLSVWFLFWVIKDLFILHKPFSSINMTNVLGLLVSIAFILVSANFDIIIKPINPKAQSKEPQESSETIIVKLPEKQNETTPQPSTPYKIYQSTQQNTPMQTSNQPAAQVQTLEQTPKKVKLPEKQNETIPKASTPFKISQSTQSGIPYKIYQSTKPKTSMQTTNQPIELLQITKETQLETPEQTPKKAQLLERPIEIKPQASYSSRFSQNIQQPTPSQTMNQPTTQPQINKNVQVETLEQMPKESQPQVQQQNPAEQGCPHFFGYLNQKDRTKGIPDGCLTCKNLIDCMSKREQTQ